MVVNFDSWGSGLQHSAVNQSSSKRLEALDYIEAMLVQLHPMAVSNGFPVLAHIIEMARIEANDTGVAVRVDSAGSDNGDKASGMAF